MINGRLPGNDDARRRNALYFAERNGFSREVDDDPRGERYKRAMEEEIKKALKQGKNYR